MPPSAIRRSQRTHGLVQSDIRAMTRACLELGGVNMGQGICDVPTPPLVKEAATQAIADNRSTYTRYDGEAALREALAWKLGAHNGIVADPETEIVVTLGASGAFAATLTALFDPGDELLMFTPFYGYHVNTARVSGVVPVFVPLQPPSFSLDLARIREAITPRTRAILINTPVNPSGKVFTAAELDALAALCIANDLLCVTDEVYEYMVYPGHTHLSMATRPGMQERTVTMGSYSKTFSITGWRIGFATAIGPLAEPIGLTNDLQAVCAPAPLQHAVAAGIRGLPTSFYTDMAAKYLQQRDQFCGVLREIGLMPIVPDGSYYVLADVSSLGATTPRAAAMQLLRETGVAGIAGSAFFPDSSGDHLLRFCFAKQPNDLDRACEALLQWRRRR